MAPKKPAAGSSSSTDASRFAALTLAPEAPGLPDPDGVAPAFATFEIVGVDLCVVNALRRAIMSDVRTAAIPISKPTETDADAVRFVKNTTVLNNEFLGHRISLAPLGFDEAQLAVFDPAKYKFVLRVKNTGAEVVNVTTGDFAVLDAADAAVPRAVRDAIFPPSPVTGDHVLLVRLRPGAGPEVEGEELHVECRARLGCGREHTRWSPVSACYFQNKVDPEAFEASLAAKLAAEGGPVPDPGSPAYEAARKQHAALDGLRDFVKNEHGEPAAFVFSLKTETRLRPAHLVLEGFRALVEKVKRLERGIREAQRMQQQVGGGDEDDDDDGSGWGKKSKRTQPQQKQPGDGEGDVDVAPVTIVAMSNMEDFYEIVVGGEDHTLGNLVQGLLYRHWVRDGGAKEASFVGYHQPHPLEDHIAFKVKCAKPGTDVGELMLGGLEWVIAHLRDIEAEWTRFAIGGDAAVSGRRRVGGWGGPRRV
jgi:DNA-directed RNA polymerase subunit L